MKKISLKQTTALLTALSVIILTASTASAASDRTLSLESIQKRVEKTHPALAQRRQEAEMAALLVERAGMNRTPRLSLSAIEGVTNEPGGAFISTLNQGEITTADFAPDRLNNPGETPFRSVALKATIPLYNGGAIEAERVAARADQEASHHRNNATTNQLRAEVARKYAELLHRMLTARRIARFEVELARTVRHYQLGDQSNPVGYSGKLTLEITKNSAASLAESNAAAIEALRTDLSGLAGGLPPGWRPAGNNARELIERNLPLPDTTGASASLRALKSVATRTKATAAMSVAALKPEVALFATTSWQGGQRGNDLAESVGLSLRWALYNSKTHHAERLAALRYDAAQDGANNAALQERLLRSTLTHQKVALAASLERREESRRFAAKRTTIASDLFRSGAISAIEFGQTYAAELSAIDGEAEAVYNYLSIQAALYTIIPSHSEE